MKSVKLDAYEVPSHYFSRKKEKKAKNMCYAL